GIVPYMFEIAQLQMYPLLEDIVHIVEVEEETDKKLEIARKRQEEEEMMRARSRFAPKYTQPASFLRTPKNYRVRLYEILRELFRKRLTTIFDKVTDEREPMPLEDTTPLLLSDLEMILDEIVPSFPAAYNMSNTCVLEYHKFVHDWLSGYVRDNRE